MEIETPVILERAMGIGPTYSAWKAAALPLCYARIFNGGKGWIRTTELIRGQIYSLLPLTTRPPFHESATYYALFFIFCQGKSVSLHQSQFFSTHLHDLFHLFKGLRFNLAHAFAADMKFGPQIFQCLRMFR